ncbi:MAG: hypothetical protein H0U76_26435 [Ktedonobacteraceae bacterium]|nr:hypothetical protein [Ktedonobacteraceae bacterium]
MPEGQEALKLGQLMLASNEDVFEVKALIIVRESVCHLRVPSTYAVQQLNASMIRHFASIIYTLWAR